MGDVGETLPDSVEALRALVLQRNEELLRRDAELEARGAALRDRDAEIAQLREYLRLLRHQRFGQKSEKVHPDQLRIFNEAEQQREASPEPDEIAVPAHTRRKGGRRPLPESLPVVEVVHEALIREWPRLVEWRREDAEGSRFHEQLRAAARQWHDRGRPRGLLWRGDALAEYTLWRRRHAPSLTPLEAAFGETSAADAARGRRIRRVIAAVAVAATAVFVVALWRANLVTSRAKSAAEGLLRDSYFEQGRLRVLDGDRLGALAPLATAYRMGSTDTPTRLLLEEAAHPTRARRTGRPGRRPRNTAGSGGRTCRRSR